MSAPVGGRPGRLVAAAAGLVALCLLVAAGMVAYRAAARFRRQPPPPPQTAPPKPPPPKKPPEPPPPKKPPEPPREEAVACPLVPVPKVYKDSGRTAELLGADAAAIVLGSRATEPERYAAERLADLLERRFRRRLPIRAEGEPGAALRQAILLGQRSTNAWLDRLCREKGLDLSDNSPGHDGFIIEPLEDQGRQVVLIGGSNPRGVIYGQDAFFDLLARAEDGRVVFPMASVRDAPTIPWRGRPICRLQTHLEPGTMDAYARARLNFIDVRHTSAIYRGWGSFTPEWQVAPFGFLPGQVPDKDLVKQVITEAHRRGIFVYGTVACAVPKAQIPTVMQTFEELIALGVDGLWVSFDDPGPGEAPEELMAEAVALGKRHGITGRCLAVTPPMAGYGDIGADFNVRGAKVPGMADATWFFTCVPSEATLTAARKIGLTRPLAWWHNWPHPNGGLLHHPIGGWSLRAGGKEAYHEIPPLAMGWGGPSYQFLRGAAGRTDAVMYFGWLQEEYMCGVLGIWAWEPEKHDWLHTRMAIYRTVFGPAQAETARDFDDLFARLKTLFIRPDGALRPGQNWPPRLARKQDRPKAEELLDQMERLLERLEAAAPSETTLPPARLHALFLEPMRATVAYARKMAAYEHPATAMPELEEKLLALLADGEVAVAEAEFTKARAALLAQIERAEADFADLLAIRESFAPARERLKHFSYWTQLAAERQKDIERLFKEVFSGRDDSALLAALGKAPEGQALGELRPAEWLRRNPLARGAWAVGLVGSGDAEALAFSCPTAGNWPLPVPGQSVDVRAEMPAPLTGGQLTLQLPILAIAPGLRPQHVALELWANEKLVLEHDPAPTPPAPGGPEVAQSAPTWLNVGVTEAVGRTGRLKLRLRLVNKRCWSRFQLVLYLGTVRLLPGDKAP